MTISEPWRSRISEIFAQSADAMAGAERQYLEAGMDDYVSKPINAPQLLAKLAALALRYPLPRNITVAAE